MTFSSLKPSTKPMKRTAMNRGTSQLKRSPMRTLVKPSARADGSVKTLKAWKGLKSKERAVSTEEKGFWDRLAKIVGCIACRLEGLFNDYVSIHHIDGRTKPGCHKKVLPLCGPHHQDDGTAIAVHPYKARFEAKYGTQEELLAMCHQILAGAEK